MGPLALVCLLGACTPMALLAKGPGPKMLIKQGDQQYEAENYAACAQSYGEAARRLNKPRAGLLYNLACCQALAGQGDVALGTLQEAINGGFWDVDHLKGDPDLVSLHETPAFKALPRAIEMAQAEFAKGNSLEVELLFQEAQGRGARDDAQQAHRAAQAFSLFHTGKAKNRDDLLKAGFILAQSDKPAHLLAAYKAGQRALESGHDNRYAMWLMATAWDGYLWSVGEPQIYGSQVRRGEDGLYTLEPIDTFAVSDAQRRSVGLPRIQQSQAKVDSMNGLGQERN